MRSIHASAMLFDPLQKHGKFGCFQAIFTQNRDRSYLQSVAKDERHVQAHGGLKICTSDGFYHANLAKVYRQLELLNGDQISTEIPPISTKYFFKSQSLAMPETLFFEGVYIAKTGWRTS